MKKINPKERVGGTALIDEIKEAILHDGEVKVLGFGIFRVSTSKGLGERVFAGKKIVMKDYKRLRFLPTISFKNEIKQLV